MMYSELRKHAEFFGRFMDLVGDGSGSINASVVGSLAAPIDFKIVVPEGKLLLIDVLLVSVRDGGPFVASGYGAISALTNGIQVVWKRYAGA